MTTFVEHIEHTKQMDQSLFLGRLSWYTMSEMKVSHTQIVQGLVAVGLGSHLPPVPKDFDVFRRICSNAELKKVAVPNEPEVFENYKLREIAGRGENLIVRRLVIERVDRKGKTLGYRQVRDIFFNRETGVIEVNAGHVDCTDEPFNAAANNLIQTVRTEFASWRGMLNAYAIREFIRKMLLSWGATPVRDGLYFTPEALSAEVEKMDTFVNNLPGTASFHSLPLVDDGKQREMVKHAFQAETVDAMQALMADIDRMRASARSISSDRYAEMLTQYQNLMSKTGDYQKLLSTELGEANSTLEIFQAKIVALREKVKD